MQGPAVHQGVEPDGLPLGVEARRKEAVIRLAMVLLIALIWPVSYTLWPAKPKSG